MVQGERSGVKVRLRVEDKPCDVLFGHAGQLVGEDILQAHQPHEDLLAGLLGERVADDVELDDATALFQTGRLIPRRVGRQQAGLEMDKHKCT